MIFGFDECEKRLKELLAKAGNLKANDTAGAQSLAKELVDFTVDSRHKDAAEIDAIAKLDALAKTTAEDLMAGVLASAVNSIAQRSKEIDAIGNSLKQQTLANLEAGKRLRLIPLRDAIDRMTDTVAAVKVVAKSLDASKPDEAAIAREIGGLSEKFAALVKAAEKAFGTS